MAAARLCISLKRSFLLFPMPAASIACSRRYSSKRCISEFFYPSNHGKFEQIPPQMYNPFMEDEYLRELICSKIPDEARTEIFEDLQKFGWRVSNEITRLGREAELNPPSLCQYDSWDRMVNELRTSDAWKQLHNVSAEEGLVAIGYEKKFGEWSRLYQYAKLYLFTPSSGLYSCPLAMTDGAARLIEILGDDGMKKRAYPKLISRDPKEFWTSGQWMTEKRGGSDVANGTSTYAVRQDDHTYCLHGYKWFSSATDADMAFTLARIWDENKHITLGSSGLSLFYLETRSSDGSMNNITMEKLKNKLGTRQLPTAELILNGTVARIVGEEGRGVSNISTMLNITRMHNTISSVALMRRIAFLARDYATKRKAFGKYLADHSLHMRTLGNIEVETRGCTLLALELAELLGKEECGVATKDESLVLRLMMPIAKLYTAKQAVAIVSEGLECFGGQGYIEDTGIPTMFRDSQVLPIWEGTTNILSLDVLRAVEKTNREVLQALGSKVKSVTSGLKDKIEYLGLQAEAQTIEKWSQTLFKFIAGVDSEEVVTTAARDISYSIAYIYIGVLLLEKSCNQYKYILHQTALKKWCQRDIPLLSHDQYNPSTTNWDVHLVMDGHKLSLK